MSLAGTTSFQVTAVRGPALRRAAGPLAMSIALAVSAAALLPVMYLEVRGWTTDPLRSVGIFLPVIAFLFLWRELRQPYRKLRGDPIGLLFVAEGIGLVEILQRHSLQLFLSKTVSVDPLPGGLAISLVASGMLLLRGGFPLLRRCLFPVVLLGITNPVPHLFNDYLDLPLQHLSADVARKFAFLIGERPTGQQLRLMFTPDFGMFIAPGCNGIRGAVTLGYLSLCAGVWKRLRPQACALLFAGGVLCGYLFNFLRLFMLVLYYKAGQNLPSIQPYGTEVDYLIGGCLFALVSFGLGSLVYSGKIGSSSVSDSECVGLQAPPSPALFAACGLLCLLPAVRNGMTMVMDRRALHPQEVAAQSLPQSVGKFQLVRQWFERSDEGITVYHWGRYSDGDPSRDVSLGLWLPLTEHDVRYSHATRGDTLVPMSPLSHYASGLGTVAYSAFRYQDADQAVYLASLECRACRGNVPGVRHRFGPFLAVSAQPVSYFRPPPGRSAVLVHSGPSNSGDDTLRSPIQDFLSGLNESVLFQELKPQPQTASIR